MSQLIDRAAVESDFVAAGVPADLAKELLDAFIETKRRFHLGDFRPNAVEGGRFSEAALRILEWQTTGAYTPLSDPQFKADRVLNALPQLALGTFPESVRIHLPRALRVIYDIRNKRDAAHLNDSIDPNLQDASIVIAILDWSLAELVRLHHHVSATDAQRIIDSLVRREVPMIQEFDGRPRILKKLGHKDLVLVLLYWWGDRPLSRKILSSWLPPAVRRNPGRILDALHDEFLVTVDPANAHITQLGMRYVEDHDLISPL